MGRKLKRKKRHTKRNIFILFLSLTLVIGVSLVAHSYLKNKELERKRNNQKQDILSHYNEYVVANKDADLYRLNDTEYTKVGKVSDKQELTLAEMEITHESHYFKLSTFEEEYYIHYKDVDKIEELTKEDDRYKRYIPFNKNIVTKEITNFYDKESNLVYTIPKSYDLPIIINKKDLYGVEFNNRLLYVKQKDVEKTKDNKNTSEKVASKVRPLAYHRIYDPETEDCNEVICLKESIFESHMKYLSDNNYLTLTTEEMSNFIDGYIRIPVKSTMITIDDGSLVTRGIKLLEKYNLNGTLFVITIRYPESDFTGRFKSDAVELHSHSHNMHWAGECAGYGTQGGGILCLPEERVLSDLKTSSELLGGSTVFCYPFYDYSTRAINLLKEAGYTMAFAGLLNTNGYAYVGTNKYKIPRATILSYTSFAEFKAYVN